MLQKRLKNYSYTDSLKKKKKKVEMKAAILHRTEAPRAITDVTLSALGLKYSISEVGYGAASVLNGALIFASLE